MKMPVQITTPFRRDLATLCFINIGIAMVIMPMEIVSNSKYNLEIPEFIGFVLGSFFAHATKKIILSLIAAYIIKFMGNRDFWKDWICCGAVLFIPVVGFNNMSLDRVAFALFVFWGLLSAITLHFARKFVPLSEQPQVLRS